MNDDWKKEFESKVRKLRSYITFTDYNMYNYRLDILGCESSYQGFKTVVIYYQLSTAINVSTIMELINLIRKNSGLYSNINRDVFLQFFMNDKDGNLIWDKAGIVPRSGAIRMARDYYEKYSAIYEKYSKVLKQLNPIPKFSSAFNFSNSRKNLFVVVHDKNGITLAPEVEERIKKFQSRWLFVCLDVNYPVEIKNLELS